MDPWNLLKSNFLISFEECQEALHQISSIYFEPLRHITLLTEGVSQASREYMIRQKLVRCVETFLKNGPLRGCRLSELSVEPTQRNQVRRALDRPWVVGSEGKFSKYGLRTLPHLVQSGPSAGDRCECPLGFHPVLSIVRYPLATVSDIEQLCSWHNLANQDEYQVSITFKYPLLQGFLDVLSPGQLGFQLWTHGVVTICRCRGPTYGHTLPFKHILLLLDPNELTRRWFLAWMEAWNARAHHTS